MKGWYRAAGIKSRRSRGETHKRVRALRAGIRCARASRAVWEGYAAEAREAVEAMLWDAGQPPLRF